MTPDDGPATVVVRCLSCGAAANRSATDSCPFCGSDLASMPLLDAFDDVDDVDDAEPTALPEALTVRVRSSGIASRVLATALPWPRSVMFVRRDDR